VRYLIQAPVCLIVDAVHIDALRTGPVQPLDELERRFITGETIREESVRVFGQPLSRFVQRLFSFIHRLPPLSDVSMSIKLFRSSLRVLAGR